MSERRYSDEEVAEILKQAAEVEHSGNSLMPSSGGLTLAELQEIGREAGISPEAMQVAAQRFSFAVQPTRRFLGFPIGVGRTVELNRTLTDNEWDRLVAVLRETFDARGVVRQEGSLRSWTNGNLQALLEPGANGQRLRLRTVKGDARPLIGGGLAMIGVAASMLLTGLLSSPIDPGFVSSMTMLSTSGAAMIAVGATRLRSWARLRQQQMDQIAARVQGEAID